MNNQDYIRQQAEAFLNYFNKDLSQSFDYWAQSKDFTKQDYKDIYRECLNFLRYFNSKEMYHAE